MATLNNLIPTGSAGVGFPPAGYAGCGFARGTELGFADPLVLGSGVSDTSDPILVGGYTGFMLTVENITGAGTVTISFNHLDPQTGVAVINRSIAAAISGPQTRTFGAFSTVGAVDVYGTINLVFLANAATETITGIRLWGHTR
jgi:hypothetical protein